MTLSTTKKVTTARAKPITTKSSAKTSTRHEQRKKNSQSQALATLSSHSQTSNLTQVLVSDGDKEPVGGILDVDSDHIMELSDGDEGLTSSMKSNMSEDEEGKEDEEAELCKTLPRSSHDKLMLGQQDGCQKTG